MFIVPMNFSCSFLIVKGDEFVEGTDGLGSICRVSAHCFSVSVLETKEVKRGDGVSSPGSSSNETVPSVFDGFTEFHWEDLGIQFLDDSEGGEGKLDKFRGHLDVTIHGTGEFSSRHI
jgi:hypothetical protein